MRWKKPNPSPKNKNTEAVRAFSIASFSELLGEKPQEGSVVQKEASCAENAFRNGWYDFAMHLKHSIELLRQFRKQDLFFIRSGYHANELLLKTEIRTNPHLAMPKSK